MFFVEFDSKNRDTRGRIEQLAIFGERRSRRGAQLKVMTAVPPPPPRHAVWSQLKAGYEFGCPYFSCPSSLYQ